MEQLALTHQELLVPGSFVFNVDERGVLLAEKELLARRTERESEGFTWGYLLGVEFYGSTTFPLATALIGSLEKQLKENEGTRDFYFSFSKVCKGQSSADEQGVHYEGMHLDTHPGLDDTNELLRMLFNFSEHPRKFYFAVIDRHALERRGVALDRKDYKTLELPADVETRVVEIPGRQGTKIHYLQFWASMVPHVGINEAYGYFLVSFETLRPAPVSSGSVRSRSIS